MDPSPPAAPLILWPPRPTCHGARSPYLDREIVWEPRGAYRHCNYCGSLHPEDLLRLLDNGYRLGGSDWKYGYPHKFYLHAAGPTRLPAPDGAGKFYTDHLRDQGYESHALTILLRKVTDHSGILFAVMEDGEIGYRAPYHGYQR